MKNSAPAANNVSSWLTPEMRRQIIKLKDELDEHELCLSGHLDILNNIRDALKIARYSASCLLTNDPYNAWNKVAR